jgi:quercetin dioxygenase-like cupin family protein
VKVYDTRALAGGAVSAKTDRPATALVHETNDARVVVFRLEPGQSVPTHASASTVLLSVIAGSGVVTGAEGERAVKAGDLVAYAEHEPHGMRAEREQLILVAVIAPRPR